MDRFLEENRLRWDERVPIHAGPAFYDLERFRAAGERFDVVFTSLGVLSWLPDIAAWAEAVAACTDPGGTFYIAEFHPLLHVFDDDGTAAYPYLERPEPTTEDEPGTYVDRQAATAHNRAHYWSHGLGQIVTALIGAGFEIEFVHERVEVFY